MGNKKNTHLIFSLSARLGYLFIFLIFKIFLILSYIDVYSQWIDAYISDFKVNDDMGFRYQGGGVVRIDSSGNFVIVWDDTRNYPNQTASQIYCQRYTKEGLGIGNNFRIGQDTVGMPALTSMKDGRFVVSWILNFSHYAKLDIYFQKFSYNAQPLGPLTKVNDSTYLVVNGLIYGLDIAYDSTGNFTICWGVSPNFGVYPKIYFQRYDSSGSRIGTLQIANDANSRAQYPRIAMNKDGSFVICWQDDRNCNYYAKYDVYMQRYSSNGIKIGNNVKVNDDLDTLVDQQGPVVSTDGRGYFVIAWGDDRNSETNIYYQLYDTNGASIGQNRKATIYSSIGLLGVPKVSMREDRKFFIGWLDVNYSSRNQFYGRRFNSNGDTIGMPYMVSMSSPGSSTQMPNSVYLFGDRIYAVWEDTRNGNSDIYCNVRGFQNPDTVIGIKKIDFKVPSKFKLYQNFPNPFNPKTIIYYELPSTNFVKLVIYDVLGREIATPVNEKQKAGKYEIDWDASNQPSGVYFYRIEVKGPETSSGQQFDETKKMVLIK